MLINGTRRFGTLRRSPAMSNTERQRRFRERNPGYYGRLHRKRKAEVMAMLAAQRAMAAAKPQLLLPAPVEQFTLFDMLNAQRERELVPINRPVAQ